MHTVKAWGLAPLLWVAAAGAGTAHIGVDSPSVVEGDSGSTTLNFTLTRSGDTTSALTVHYQSDDSTAVAPADYVSLPPATATFAAGDVSVVVPVSVQGDLTPEADESLFLHLTGVDVEGLSATFAAPVAFPASESPSAFAAADLNGDGVPDLAVTNGLDRVIGVLLNTTATDASTPSFATRVDFATGANARGLAALDLNADGRPDLASANGSSDDVTVWLNTTVMGDAAPSFAGRTEFAAGLGPVAAAALDVNADGRPDLALASGSSDSVTVLLNTTSTGAAAPSFATASLFGVGDEPDAVAVADFNADGRPDLAAANLYGASVSVLLNTTAASASTATFAASAAFTVGSQPTSVAAVDVNGDGRPDLVAVNSDGNSVSVLLNTAAPGAVTASFADASTFATASTPCAVAAADLDGDGRADLAVTHANGVSVFLNTTAPGAATAAFAPAATVALDGYALAITIVDFNGDARPDLAVSRTGGFMSVLLNTTAAAPLAVIDTSEGVGTLLNDDGSAADTVPDAFSFAGASGVAPGATITSAAITVSGIDAAAAIGVSGASGSSYSIDGGAFTAAAGTVANGQAVRVRHVASASTGTAASTILTIGGVAGTFTSTTQAATAAPASGGAIGLVDALLGLLAFLGLRRDRVRRAPQRPTIDRAITSFMISEVPP